MEISLFICYFCSFYILGRSKVISERVQTWHSVHSLQLYSAAPLENQAAGTMAQTLLHYPDTGRASPGLILRMPSSRQGNDKYQFDQLLV